MMITKTTGKVTTTTTYELDDEGHILREITETVVEEPQMYPEPKVTVLTDDDREAEEGVLFDGELTFRTPIIRTLLSTLAGALVGTLLGRSVCKILECSTSKPE